MINVKWEAKNKKTLKKLTIGLNVGNAKTKMKNKTKKQK